MKPMTAQPLWMEATTTATAHFHTLVTRMATPSKRQIDGLDDLGGLDSWLNGSAVASASALATSFGLATNDSSSSHDWIVLPIVCGSVLALVALSVFLLGITKKCLGIPAMPQGDGDVGDNSGGPDSSSGSVPKTTSSRAGCLGLSKLSGLAGFTKTKRTSEVTEMEEALPSAWVRLLSPENYPHAAPIRDGHPHPLASNPPTLAAPEPTKAKGKGILRSNSLKRLSYGIRRVTDPIYNRSSESRSETPAFDGDLSVYAANLPSSSGHRRGRSVRSEGGRETQLKLQQSASSASDNDCAVESASDCSGGEEDVPEMLPTMPRHRQVQAPKSILKRPSDFKETLGLDLTRCHSRYMAPAAAATSEDSKGKSYVPRWAAEGKEGAEERAGKKAIEEDDTDEACYSGPTRRRRGVRFGEDMVRRISIMSTVVDEEEDWITVSSSESSVKGKEEENNNSNNVIVVKQACAMPIQRIAVSIAPRPVLLSSPEPAF